MKCSGCKYYEKITPFAGYTGQNKGGNCRRYPEKIQVTPADWCGEYVSKRSKK